MRKFRIDDEEVTDEDIERYKRFVDGLAGSHRHSVKAIWIRNWSESRAAINPYHSGFARVMSRFTQGDREVISSLVQDGYEEGMFKVLAYLNDNGRVATYEDGDSEAVSLLLHKPFGFKLYEDWQSRQQGYSWEDEIAEGEFTPEFSPEPARGRRQAPSHPPPLSADDRLYEAIQAGDLGMLFRCINEGVELNKTGPIGLSPLLLAYYRGNPEVVRCLLRHGADTDTMCERVGTAIMAAAADENDTLLALFLEHTRNVDLALPKSRETALHFAVSHNRSRAVRSLLAAGADPNHRVRPGVPGMIFSGNDLLRGEAPIHLAAAYADFPTVTALLEAGADRHAADAFGMTPRNYAARHRREPEMIALLT